jgi:hypothetical protein
VALARKWLGDGGFQWADVERALKETAASASPSFKYLDGILSRHRDSAGRMAENIEAEQKLAETLREALRELGAQARTLPQSQLDACRSWISGGLRAGGDRSRRRARVQEKPARV